MPPSFRIIELGKTSCKIFDFKGLICKIFRNKDLACQRALKMALGQLRGAVLVDGYTSKLPQSDLYRHARLVLCQWILKLVCVERTLLSAASDSCPEKRE